MLRRLDGVRPHAVEIDALGLGVAHNHRLQAGNAHLHGLLDHVIEPGALERREQVVQIAGRRLRPHLGLDRQDGAAFAGTGETGLPFAVRPIEDQHPVAGCKPQHVAQIMDLGRFQSDCRAGMKSGGDVEAGTAKLVTGHRLADRRAYERTRGARPYGTKPPGRASNL